MMQKTKTILFSRKKQASSSPDTKRSNAVKPTYPPMQQIQKFLDIKNHQAKIKEQLSAHKMVPVSQKHSEFGLQKEKGREREKEEYYCRRIQELEAEVSEYQGYIKECEGLADRNRKLEEQMAFVLEELENRYMAGNEDNYVMQTPQLSPKNHEFRTLETSVDINQNSPQYNDLHLENRGGRASQVSRDQQIQYLYEYIENLKNSMKQMIAQTQQLEVDLRKGVKKDLNQMEQRLMNYIFGLEERVSETTFRNHDILKKIETARERDGEGLDFTRRSGKSDQPGDSGSLFRLSDTGGVNGKKDSVISMMNLEISDGPELKTAKKDHSLVQTPKITVNKCQKCPQHIRAIEDLTKRSFLLEQELSRYKQLLGSKPRSQPIKLEPSNQNPYQHEFTLEQIREEQSSKEQSQVLSRSTKRLHDKMSLLQSNINILIDSSGESSFAIHDKNAYPSDLIRSSSSNQSRPNGREEQLVDVLKMQKVKEQLVNIMRELQKIVHECESQPRGGLVGELTAKLNQQAEYINELEEELARLRMEVEERRTSRERLEKFMKMQVREEEEAQSPYFKPISEPISCIDHTVTKGKINHILKQIKKFEIELDQKEEKSQSSSF